MTTPPRRSRPGAIATFGLAGAPGPATIGPAIPTPPAPAPDATTPRRPDVVTSPAPATPAQAPRVAYTLRLTEQEADDLDDLARGLRRPTSRRRLDKSDTLRALIRLAIDDDTVRAALITALRDGS